MPTTSNPAATSSAAVTDESTPPDIATTMRWSAGAPARSMSASGRFITMGIYRQDFAEFAGKAHRIRLFPAGPGRQAGLPPFHDLAGLERIKRQAGKRA